MADFLDRMKAEHTDLSDRLEKLDTFVEGETFAGLDLERRTLLLQQRAAMHTYRDTLQQRIDVESRPEPTE